MRVSFLVFFFALNFSPICKSQMFMNVTDKNWTMWANYTTKPPQLNLTLWNLTTAAAEPVDWNNATVREREAVKSTSWSWNWTRNGTSNEQERIINLMKHEVPEFSENTPPGAYCCSKKERSRV